MIAIALATALTMPTKFDLVCTGRNSFVGFGGQKPIPYEERFSIDLTAGLFSNSDYTSPQKIAESDEQIVWLQRYHKRGKGSLSLAVSRIDGSVSGENDYGDGHKVELIAACKLEPFTRWDHRAF